MTTRLKRSTARRQTVPLEYTQLLALRLKRDWSWAYLEMQMTLAGCPLSRATLVELGTRKLQRGPYERTVYKIRQFLKRHRSHHRRKTDTGRPSTAA